MIKLIIPKDFKTRLNINQKGYTNRSSVAQSNPQMLLNRSLSTIKTENIKKKT